MPVPMDMNMFPDSMRTESILGADTPTSQQGLTALLSTPEAKQKIAEQAMRSVSVDEMPNQRETSADKSINQIKLQQQKSNASFWDSNLGNVLTAGIGAITTGVGLATMNPGLFFVGSQIAGLGEGRIAQWKRTEFEKQKNILEQQYRDPTQGIMLAIQQAGRAAEANGIPMNTEIPWNMLQPQLEAFGVPEETQEKLKKAPIYQDTSLKDLSQRLDLFRLEGMERESKLANKALKDASTAATNALIGDLKERKSALGELQSDEDKKKFIEDIRVSNPELFGQADMDEVIRRTIGTSDNPKQMKGEEISPKEYTTAAKTISKMSGIGVVKNDENRPLVGLDEMAKDNPALRGVSNGMNIKEVANTMIDNISKSASVMSGKLVFRKNYMNESLQPDIGAGIMGGSSRRKSPNVFKEKAQLIPIFDKEYPYTPSRDAIIDEIKAAFDKYNQDPGSSPFSKEFINYLQMVSHGIVTRNSATSQGM